MPILASLDLNMLHLDDEHEDFMNGQNWLRFLSLEDERMKDGRMEDGRRKDGRRKDGRRKDGRRKDGRRKDGRRKDGRRKDNYGEIYHTTHRNKRRKKHSNCMINSDEKD